MVYIAAVTAAPKPQNNACGDITKFVGSPWVASKNVPITTHHMAMNSRAVGNLHAEKHVAATISTGPIYSSTVAVPAFEY